MNIGLGEVTAPVVAPSSAPAVPVPLSAMDMYMAGLKAWASPGAAFSALGTTLSNMGTAFSGAVLPATLGLWTPPLVLAAVVFSMGRRGRR